MAVNKEALVIPLSGRLITAVDGTQIGVEDYQILKNMRYTNTGIKSVTGMTKINTTPTPEINITNGFHFKKSYPVESHVMITANGKVYKNDTAIPNAGAFTVSPAYTGSSGYGLGRFAITPDSALAYCNGIDTVIWGGDEAKIGKFIIGENLLYDFTKEVNNSINSATERAVMYTEGAVDANTMLLLHMNGADGSTTFTDSSPTTPHTVTANGNAQIDTIWSKFGGASGLFDGTGDYLTIPHDADFDFSGGNWTVDTRFRTTTVGAQVIYYKQTDANNYITINLSGTNQLIFIIYAATIKVILSGSTLNINTDYHIEVSEKDDSYYMFVDGILVASTSDTDRAANYTGSVYIGTDAIGANGINGWLDEFRVSNVCRHTTDFTLPVNAYGTTASYLKLGLVRPLKGLKLYNRTPNNQTATSEGFYWSNGGWTALTNYVDGTIVSGKTLAQTGSITFDDTQSVAQTSLRYNTLAYWYLFTFININAATEIYQATVNSNFVSVTDIWNGITVHPVGYLVYTTLFTDYFSNIYNEDWVSGATQTYASIGGLTSANYQLTGFAIPISALYIGLSSSVNTNVSNITIQYYNGSSFVTVGTVVDGTTESGKSFSKPGWISWTSSSDEQQYTPFNGETAYYYKILFNATLSATVQLDYIEAIPAPVIVKKYAFPIQWQNRLLLCNQVNDKNKILMSSAGTSSVFNGSDTMEIFLGDNQEIIAAAPLFARFNNATYDNLVVCKQQETWLLDGTGVNNYIAYQISPSIGCVAPLTMISCNIGLITAIGTRKAVVLWQSTQGIMECDGSSIISISTDISNLFDPNSSDHINFSYINLSTAFFDEVNNEYHWLFASGVSTIINREFVFNIVLRKWYEVDRTTGKYLTCGIPVVDTLGNKYIYGCLNTGYLERLDYGTTFDGVAITSLFKTGDIAMDGLGILSKIRNIKLISKANTTETASVLVTHYGDAKTVGTTLDTMAITSSTHRIVQPTQSVNLGDSIFHAFEFSIPTTLQTVGFEPLGIHIYKVPVREDR